MYPSSRRNQQFSSPRVLTLKHSLMPLFALAILFAALPANGQEDNRAERQDEAFFQIEFPGGTVAEYVQQLRNPAAEAHYPHLNIVLSDIPPAFRLPEIMVFTDLDGMLGCLAACSTDEYQVEVDTDETGTVTVIRVVDIGSERQAPDQTTVLNVKKLLSQIPQEDFVAAINLGLDFSGTDDGVQIKLHNETGLLFARGRPEGLALVREIVEQLKTVPLVQGGDSVDH